MLHHRKYISCSRHLIMWTERSIVGINDLLDDSMPKRVLFGKVGLFPLISTFVHVAPDIDKMPALLVRPSHGEAHQILVDAAF